MKILQKFSLSEARQKVLRSSGWLLAKQVINTLNTLVLGVLIARHLGPAGFAVLSYATSLIALVGPLRTLGMRNLSLREYTRVRDETDEILGTVTLVRLCGILVSMVVVYFVATWFPTDYENIAILCVILAGAALFSSIDTLQELFIVDQDPRPFVI